MAEALELKRETQGESLVGALLKFASSSVGSKVIMAVTGLGLWLWFIAHLAGNLTIYLGHDTFNHYAAALQENPPVLWGQRLALLLGIPLHIFAAVRAAAINRAARPQGYAFAEKSPASGAAKSMIITGGILVAYIVFHLAHFTLRAVGPQPEHHDAYNMVVMGFKEPLIAGTYVVAMLLLGAHLSHGIYSLFQHLGFWGRKWTPFIKSTALIVGWGLVLAFASIPVSVLLGVIK